MIINFGYFFLNISRNQKDNLVQLILINYFVISYTIFNTKQNLYLVIVNNIYIINIKLMKLIITIIIISVLYNNFFFPHLYYFNDV